MGRTPSWEDLEYEYSRLCRLLEEGQAAPSQSPSSSSSPLPQGGAPCTTPRGPCTPPEPPHKRIPPWAKSATRGFFNTVWLLILVFVIVPMGMQSSDMEDVLACVFFFLLILAFPVMGYGFTGAFE